MKEKKRKTQERCLSLCLAFYSQFPLLSRKMAEPMSEWTNRTFLLYCVNVLKTLIRPRRFIVCMHRSAPGPGLIKYSPQWNNVQTPKMEQTEKNGFSRFTRLQPPQSSCACNILTTTRVVWPNMYSMGRRHGQAKFAIKWKCSPMSLSFVRMNDKRTIMLLYCKL